MVRAGAPLADCLWPAAPPSPFFPFFFGGLLTGEARAAAAFAGELICLRERGARVDEVVASSLPLGVR